MQGAVLLWLGEVAAGFQFPLVQVFSVTVCGYMPLGTLRDVASFYHVVHFGQQACRRAGTSAAWRFLTFYALA